MAYDQNFFLDLAAKGKDAWNAWQHDRAVRVTFAGVDFSEAPRDGIDFSGFVFGDVADFSRCKWRGAEWAEIQEGFKPGRACFTHAVFGEGTSFAEAAFGNGASFLSAGFNGGASFADAHFGGRASFVDARFAGMVNFADAAFGEQASFVGALFGNGANFDKTFFKGRVEFNGRPSPSEEISYRASWGRDRFLTISFANARFDGEADFSGRSFEQAADFTNAHFYYPPDFDSATNLARIDFTGAYIGFGHPLRLHWTSKSKIPVRLRALRKIAEDTKNHDLERDLYIEERKAERGVYLHQLLGLDELKKNLEDINKQKKHVWLEWRLQRRARNAHWLRILAKPDKITRLFARLLWIAVMGVYWALANYGRSFLLPAALLGLSVPLFYWGYDKILAPLMPQGGTLDAAKYARAEWMVALGNAVPFVGPLTIDSKVKEFLFCPCRNCPDPLIPPEGYQWLVLGQNLFSITCVFFIGLALRNYFRIK